MLGFVFTLAALILWIIQMIFYFSLFKYIWLIVGSPVFSYLSEKTHAILTGVSYPFSRKQMLHDMARGIKIALRNMLWQTVYMASIMILALIPLIGWATPLFALLIECYYYGFSMLDYNCERKKNEPAAKYFFYWQSPRAGNRQWIIVLLNAAYSLTRLGVGSRLCSNCSYAQHARCNG